MHAVLAAPPAANWSRHKLVGNLRRTIALDDGFCTGIVSVLQHRPLAEELTAYNDRHRASWAALFGVDSVWRHQIDLALRPGSDRGNPHLGIAVPAAVIDAVVVLEALRSVEHAVEYPGVGVVVHAAGPPRHAHHGVDNKTVLRIDVEQ